MSLAAVVIHFGDPGSTVELVEDLVGGHPDVAVIVINNGPDDDLNLHGSLAVEVTVIGPAVNRGYATAANLGIEQAIRLGHDDVVVLPDDGHVDDGALSTLRDGAARVGATLAGPLVLYRDSEVIWANGLDFNRRWGVARNKDKGKTWTGDTTTVDVEYVTGHAILLRGVGERPWLRFDEDLFLYYEDIAICDEVRARREKVALVREAIVYHQKKGLASYRFGSAQQRHMARSGLVYWAKHTSGFDRLTHLTGFTALTIYRLIRSADARAILDGLSGLSNGIVEASRILIGLRNRSTHP